MKNKAKSSLQLTGILVLTIIGSFFSCNKSDFLGKKPSTSLIVPSTLADFQALLDNTAIVGYTPVLGEVSADNYYLDSGFWLDLDIPEQNAHIWAPNIYGDQGQIDDWNVPYQQVFYANIVLEGLANVPQTTTNAAQWNSIKGSALFTRAYAFFNLAQLFAPVYDSSRATGEPGIPLRLSSDINTASVRATVQATYQQIQDDLSLAIGLLPAVVSRDNLSRPSRPAAQAMLARVFLSEGNYDQALTNANASLLSNSGLADYNDTALFLKPEDNVEILYQSTFLTYTQIMYGGGFFPGLVLIDSNLYNSYDSNDRRRIFLYLTTTSGSSYLNKSYSGNIFPFSGLAADEMYLTRAECFARAGNVTNAMRDLNYLLIHRWITGTFKLFTAASPSDALNLVLAERRKELAFRGIRWTDLRRLNRNGGNITLARNLNGVHYQLMPNSPLYTLTIPPAVLSFNPGMPDNPR